MYKQQIKLKDSWQWNNCGTPATEEEIKDFETKNNLILPPDLSDYFKIINGIDDYDDHLFQFYSLNRMKRIDQHLIEWDLQLPPDLNLCKGCFIFADYQIHLFSYVIQLHKNIEKQNHIYLYRGANYKVIANSFAEFIKLCLADSQLLYFND